MTTYICHACHDGRTILVEGYPETCASCPVRYQSGTTPETGADLTKYEVGGVLKFVSRDPDEFSVSFNTDDLLVVERDNPGAMGIVVKRWPDGLVDMVWPTEVRVLSTDEIVD